MPAAARRQSRLARPRAGTHPCPARISDIRAQHGPVTGATLSGVTTAGPAQGTELTAREAEVLALIARHLTNAQIADALFISTRTVESHVSAMLRKLQLPDRRSLARHAEAMPGLLGQVRPARAAGAGHAVHRPHRRAGGAGRGARRAPHGHRDRSGRRRQDPAGAERRRRARPGAPRRRVVRRSGPRDRPGDGHRGGRRDGRRSRAADHVGRARAGRLARRQRRAARPRQLRARARRRPGLRRADRRRLPGASPCWRRAGPGCSSRTSGCTSCRGCRSSAAAAMPSTCSPPGWPPRRATRRRRTPARVAALCRALDGMALAIELAAARFPALGLDGLESGLDQRLRFLTAGSRGADRHGSLREAIGWSYDLLSADDRALLRGVAVFASWFDVDAACAVAGAGRRPRRGRRRAGPPGRAQPARRRARRADQVPRAGDDPPVRRRAAGRGRRAGPGPGRPRAVVPAGRRAARPDRRRPTSTRPGAPGSTGSSTTSAPRSPGPPATRPRRAQAAGLAAELAGLLFARGRPAQAQRRYEQAAELAPAGTERAALPAAGRRLGRQPLRRRRGAAAVPDGGRRRRVAPATGPARRGTWRRWRCTSTARRGSWPRRTRERRPTRCSPKPRALSDGSPLVRAALAVAEFGAPARRSATSRRVAELAERAGDGILHEHRPGPC